MATRQPLLVPGVTHVPAINVSLQFPYLLRTSTKTRRRRLATTLLVVLVLTLTLISPPQHQLIQLALCLHVLCVGAILCIDGLDSLEQVYAELKFGACQEPYGDRLKADNYRFRTWF